MTTTSSRPSSSSARAESAGRRLLRQLRRLGLGLGLGLAAAGALGFGGFVFIASELRIERRWPAALPAELPAVSAAPVSLAKRVTAVAPAGVLERGRHLVRSVTQCNFCHGDDLGGAALVDDPWIGRLYAPNLTSGRGGLGGALDAAALAPAMRRGLRSDGRSVWLMPTAGLGRLSDAELEEIAAYLNAAPPVDRETPGRRAGPLSRLALVLGQAPDLLSAEWIRPGATAPGTSLASAGPAAARPPSPGAETAAARVSRGEHLVEVASCRVCHRPDLRGGLHPLSLPDEPAPPDLTPSGRLVEWSQADFVRAMREGRTPDGAELDERFMPWRGFAGLTDEELADLWAYLRSLRS